MINVTSIEKSYGSHQVLKKISFQVEKGQVYGLVGKNGAGKTTLINILAGINKQDKGEVSMPANCKIGYLPDVPKYYEYLSCGEYLEFLMLDVKEKASLKQRLLTLASLEENIMIKNMSRGMRQRLGMAAALVSDPDILLLDEPTSALDPEGRNTFFQMLLMLKETGKSILLSTHILTDMEKVCDKVGFLQDGVIKYESVLEDLTIETAICVTFASDCAVKVMEKAQLKEKGSLFTCVQQGADRVVFTLNPQQMLEAQKELFTYLGSLDYAIVSIENESKTLEDLFQEVCGK